MLFLGRSSQDLQFESGKLATTTIFSRQTMSADRSLRITNYLLSPLSCSPW